MQAQRIVIHKGISLRSLEDDLLPQIRNDFHHYVVDLSRLRFISAPEAVNLLLFMGYLWKLSNERKPDVIPPNSREAKSFLSNVRFVLYAQEFCNIDRLLFPEPASSIEMARRMGILEIRSLSNTSPSRDFYAQLNKTTEDTILGKISDLVGSRLDHVAAVFVELCKNVYEHSRSYGFVAAQPRKVDHQQSVIELTIGDMGVGLFKSLSPLYLEDEEKRKYWERRLGPFWSEAKALDIAFAIGVSEKAAATGEKAGVGLWSVLVALQDSGGHVICRSGTHKMFLGYWHNEWKTQIRDTGAFFPGTQFEVHLPITESDRPKEKRK